MFESKVDLFLAELATYGIGMARENAVEVIRNVINDLMRTFDFSEADAEARLDDNIIRQIAENAAFSMVDERPGSNMIEDTDTVGILLSELGRVVTFLATAIDLRVKNGAAVGVTEVAEVISVFSTCLIDRVDGDIVQVPVSALARASRMVTGCGRMLESGDWKDTAGRENLADFLLTDGEWIKSLVSSR